jgi:hypothetical protein
METGERVERTFEVCDGDRTVAVMVAYPPPSAIWSDEDSRIGEEPENEVGAWYPRVTKRIGEHVLQYRDKEEYDEELDDEEGRDANDEDLDLIVLDEGDDGDRDEET